MTGRHCHKYAPQGAQALRDREALPFPLALTVGGPQPPLKGQRAAEQGQAEESKAPKGPGHSAEAVIAQEFKLRSPGA